MPSQILPGNYVRLARYSTTLDIFYQGVPDAEIPFPLALRDDYTTKIAAFRIEYGQYYAASENKQAATDVSVSAKVNLYRYVSHFVQVLNMSIERGEILPSARQHYQLDGHADQLPNMRTEALLIQWAGAVISGETARVAAGGTALANPSAAQVQTALTQFTTAQQAQQQATNTAEDELQDLPDVFLPAYNAYLEIIEFMKYFYRNLTPAQLRNKLRRHGMEYRNDVGESTTIIITVAAGANYTVNEITPSGTTLIRATPQTDATPGLFLCRNVLAGCAADGKQLVFGTTTEAIFNELPGNDEQAVLSNTTAVDITIELEFVG